MNHKEATQPPSKERKRSQTVLLSLMKLLIFWQLFSIFLTAFWTMKWWAGTVGGRNVNIIRMQMWSWTVLPLINYSSVNFLLVNESHQTLPKGYRNRKINQKLCRVAMLKQSVVEYQQYLIMVLIGKIIIIISIQPNFICFYPFHRLRESLLQVLLQEPE